MADENKVWPAGGDEGWIETVQKASDEALEMIYDMFGFGSQGKQGRERPSGPGRAYYFGEGEGFNASSLKNVAIGEWNSFTDAIMGFYSAVHWSEPWIICLGLFHILMLTIVIVTRKDSNMQIGLFLVILGLVYFAETINGVAAQHWKSFSKQNYFDKQGIFLSTVMSGPLLVIAIIMLFHSLYTAASLMVKVKRQHVRSQIRANRGNGAQEGGGADESKKSK